MRGGGGVQGVEDEGKGRRKECNTKVSKTQTMLILTILQAY